MAKVKRCGVYVRVSTDLQHTDAQESELKAFIQARGWVIHRIYADRGVSGAQKSRPALDQLWTDCRKRKIDVCLVWSLDRLARSLKQLIESLEEFRQLGMDFISLKQNFDTSTSSGRLLMHMVASFSEFERDLIRERTMAGMAEARRRGRPIGRPPLRKFLVNEIEEIKALHRKDHVSIRQLAIRFGTTQWTVARLVAKRPSVPATGPYHEGELENTGRLR
jgi:DNA invertase Pin-like site-specific DNA recombinase